jgi:hypothetical protein
VAKLRRLLRLLPNAREFMERALDESLAEIESETGTLDSFAADGPVTPNKRASRAPRSKLTAAAKKLMVFERGDPIGAQVIIEQMDALFEERVTRQRRL